MDLRSAETSSDNGVESDLPNSPTEAAEFAIYGEEARFTPVYYPKEFRVTTEKEFKKVDAGPEGQKISIDVLKNSTLHVTGRVHSSDLYDLNDLAHTSRPVDVITPVIVEGGMEAYVQKAERGNIVGYDNFPTAQDWLVEYTIDLVSTGKDEYAAEQSSLYQPSE